MCLNAVVFAAAGRSVAFESLENRRLLSSYYVDVTGSDSNPGTLELPFRTIQPAASRADAGDTIFVHPGEYPGFIVGWDYPQNGLPDAPITFKADPGAVITSRNNKTNDIINLEGTNYVIIDGFTIAPSPGAGQIRAGIRAAAGGVGEIIRNNTVQMRPIDNYGIYSSFSTDILVEHNNVSGTFNSLIYTANSAVHPTIRGNIVHDGIANGMHFNGDGGEGASGVVSNALVEGNLVYNVGTAGGSAINMDGVQNSRVQNNIVYNAHGKGITLYQIDSSDAAKHNVIANNTVILAPGNIGYAMNLKSGSSDNAILNNILIGNNSGYSGAMNISPDSLPGLFSDNNIVSDRFTVDDGGSNVPLAAWQDAEAHDLHSIVVTDPAALFVDLANNDYHLSPSSAAINAGMNFAASQAPMYDFSGAPRPNGANWDIGAYELTGPVDTTPPVVSGVVISNVTSLRATIAWITDEPTTAVIEYGLDTNYGSTTAIQLPLLNGRSFTLRNLTPSTTYHFRIVTTDAAGNVGYSEDSSFTTDVPDVTIPTISELSVPVRAPVYAIITWTTDEAADSLIEYGLTTDYGSTLSASAALANHQLKLTGLLPSTTYHFRVHSKDESLNDGVSEDATFTTTAVGAVPAGLLVSWEFGEYDGPTTADSAGNRHTATLYNGTTRVPGVSGNALNFDGFDDSVRVPRAPELEPTSVTVGAWVKLAADTQQPWATIVKKTYASDAASPYGTYNLAMSPDGHGNILCFFTGHPSSINELNSPTPLPTGRWIFVAGTFDSSTGEKRLYVDGALVASNVIAAPLLYDTTSTGDLYFGQDPGEGEAFAGFIDNVRIWDRPLDASEIATLGYVLPSTTVNGTFGDDIIRITYGGSSQVEVQVNSDSPYFIDLLATSEIKINGMGGGDQLIITTTSGDDEVLFSARGLTYKTITTPITHTNLETVLWNSGGGHDKLHVSSDGVVGLAADATLSGLEIVPSGKLDIRQQTLVVEYGVGNPSVRSDLEARVSSARNGGLWDNPGILSSYANAASMTVGVWDDPAAGTVTVKTTHYGDATGDGLVGISDLFTLAMNWNVSGAIFSQADFNYDGKVDALDLGLLSANWQVAVGGAAPMAGVIGLPTTTPVSPPRSDEHPVEANNPMTEPTPVMQPDPVATVEPTPQTDPTEVVADPVETLTPPTQLVAVTQAVVQASASDLKKKTSCGGALSKLTIPTSPLRKNDHCALKPKVAASPPPAPQPSKKGCAVIPPPSPKAAPAPPPKAKCDPAPKKR